MLIRRAFWQLESTSQGGVTHQGFCFSALDGRIEVFELRTFLPARNIAGVGR